MQGSDTRETRRKPPVCTRYTSISQIGGARDSPEAPGCGVIGAMSSASTSCGRMNDTPRKRPRFMGVAVVAESNEGPLASGDW